MALLEHFVSITLLYFVCVCAVLSPWFVDVIAIIAIVGHLNAIGPYWLLLESNQDFLWDNRMLSSACVCVSLFIDQLFELLLSSGTDFQWQTILITLSHFHYHTNSDTHTHIRQIFNKSIWKWIFSIVWFRTERLRCWKRKAKTKQKLRNIIHLFSVCSNGNFKQTKKKEKIVWTGKPNTSHSCEKQNEKILTFFS